MGMSVLAVFRISRGARKLTRTPDYKKNYTKYSENEDDKDDDEYGVNDETGCDNNSEDDNNKKEYS